MKKASTLLFTLLSLCITTTFAQTNVSGIINTNTTWTKAASPYILTGTVGVPADYTLTIEPGAVVTRQGNYHIIIIGNLVAKGTEADSISFISNGAGANASNFFIEFQKSNLNNSSIRFIRFNGEGKNPGNIRVGNEDEFSQTSPKNSGKLTISRSYLKYGRYDTKGYQAANSLTIDSSRIDSAFVTGNYPRSEQIIIAHSIVSNTKFFSDSYNYGISFTQSDMDNCLFQVGCCGSNFSFSNSHVVNSEMYNIGGSGSSTTPITISYSIFLNSPIYLQEFNLSINHAKFITDKLVKDKLSNTEISYLIKAASATLDKCEILDLSGRSYSGIQLAGTFVNGDNSIINSLFSHVKDAVVINDFTTINFSENNFKAIGGYHISNYSKKDFSALNNYFELKPGQTFYDIIFDSHHNITYGAVNHTPYSTTILTTPPVSMPENVHKTLQDGYNIILTWDRNKEANIKSYTLYFGHINPFKYIYHVTDLSTTVNTFSIGGFDINDSIALTAVNDYTNNSITDPSKGIESWYSPAVIADSAALAINNTTFTAAYSAGKTYLNWQATDVTNTQYFNVERSTNGASFSKIGVVNAGATHSYNFTDETPAIGNNYYRLKEVDKNNIETYSKVIKINTQNTRISLYPNPVKDYVTVSAPAGSEQIIVVNSLGQKLLSINTAGQSRQQYTINTASLAAGVYRVMIITNNSQTETATFVK